MVWTFDDRCIASVAPSSDDLPSMALSSGDSGITNEITQYDSTCALVPWVVIGLAPTYR